jgi:hypothetical protein
LREDKKGKEGEREKDKRPDREEARERERGWEGGRNAEAARAEGERLAVRSRRMESRM